MTKIKRCYLDEDLNHLHLKKGDSYHKAVENVNKILSGLDYPEELFLKFEEEESEQQDIISCTDCKDDPDYVYCGEDLPHLNVRNGDLFSDIFKNINEKILDNIGFGTVVLRNSLGTTLLTDTVDTDQTKIIQSPDGSVNIRINGVLQQTDTVASGEIKNINLITPPCAPANYNLVNSDSTVLSSGSIASGGSANIAAPDSNLVINGGSPIAIPSGDTYNLTVQVISKEWVFQFLNQTDTIQIVATVNNIATFTSGVGTNVGTIEVSTDGVTYIPLVFPFSPSVGTYYFKRSTALVTATYTISE